jgi:ABC-type Fe3+-hydroxamate transport system substrate-binding protein
MRENKTTQMIKLLDILREMIGFSNWKIPSISQLKQEFKIEQEMKGNEFWEDEEEFINAVKNGKIITITPSEDQNIYYRSGTESYDELLDLR